MKNYLSWLEPGNKKGPLLSPSLCANKIFPRITPGQPLFFILIDNMRFDQWKIISSELAGLYRILEDEIYYSILPTTTQFSRNSIFAGLMPLQIADMMPQYWINEDEEEGKIEFEEELFRKQLSRNGLNYNGRIIRSSRVMRGKR
jgi:hypothetical protein